MKISFHRVRPPGALYLRTARLLYTEQAVAVIFQSAVADYQDELRAAAGARVARFVARCRWSWALLTLLVTTPLLVRTALRADHAAMVSTLAAGWLFIVLYALPFAGAWSCFREFMIAAGTSGSLLACAMRARSNGFALVPSPVAGPLGRHFAWEVPSVASVAPALAPQGSTITLPRMVG